VGRTDAIRVAEAGSTLWFAVLRLGDAETCSGQLCSEGVNEIPMIEPSGD
jgi:hypothetical protein